MAESTCEDDSIEQRIRTAKKTGPQSWEGTAPGCANIAMGTEKRDVFNRAYSIDMLFGDETPVWVRFEDWM